MISISNFNLNRLFDFVLFRFSSSEEEFYCVERFKKARFQREKLVITISFFLHSFGCLIIPYVVDPSFKKVALFIHASIALVQFMALVTRGRWFPFQLASSSSWLILVLGYCYANSIVYQHKDLESYSGAASAFLMGIQALHFFLSPRYLKFDSVIPILSMVAVFLSYANALHQWIFFLCYFVIAAWSLLLRRFSFVADMQVYRREYQHRLQVMPEAIALASVDHDSLRKVFIASQRTGVYISSDWRSYQRLTAKLTSEQLSDLLSDYYDLCIEQLRIAFPGHEFFLDWIADELFVVIICHDEKDLKEKISASIQFSVKLLEEKKEFFKARGHVQSIDIGITFGKAHIGMMGPGRFLKATALGTSPGRARRLQSAGKELRRELGEADRVVMDIETFFKVSQPFDVKEYTLKAKVDDLEDNKVFYVEDTSSPEIQT